MRWQSVKGYMTDTSQTSFDETIETTCLKCPYCGYTEDTVDLDFLDEHEQPVECAECQQRFMARCETRYTYYGSPIE